MLEVNVKEARSKLGTLLDRVERGEEIIIKRRGKKNRAFGFLGKTKGFAKFK